MLRRRIARKTLSYLVTLSSKDTLLIAALVSLIVVTGGLVACSQSEHPPPVVAEQQSATVVPDQDPAATGPLNASATDQPEPPGPIEDPPVAETTPSSPTATATWPPSVPEVPCGVILPILSDGPDPTIQDFDDTTLDLNVPEVAQPALERLLQAPETVGLVAFQVGRESEGVYVNADAPMPLASVVKIINLVAYAEAAGAGELDPAEWVSLDDVAETYLPRSDRGAHIRALADLEERRLIAFDPPSTPLEEIPGMMIRYSSNAASDYLHLRLGQEAIEQTVVDLGLSTHTAPCPWVGQFLSMANRQTAGDNSSLVQSYIDDPESYGREVMRLAESFAADHDLRALESEPGWRASLNTQILFSDNMNAQASARDYAGLMSRIVQNGLADGYTNILVRRALEWPMELTVNQELFTTVGFKDGSLPGVLTTAYYAHRIEDGATIVVVLFYRQLPRQTYRQWLANLPHDEFARWLLSEPSAIPELRAALQIDG